MPIALRNHQQTRFEGDSNPGNMNRERSPERRCSGWPLGAACSTILSEYNRSSTCAGCDDRRIRASITATLEPPEERTECKRGHELSEQNMRRVRNTFVCRACERERDLARRESRRAA